MATELELRNGPLQQAQYSSQAFASDQVKSVAIATKMLADERGASRYVVRFDAIHIELRRLESTSAIKTPAEVIAAAKLYEVYMLKDEK